MPPFVVDTVGAGGAPFLKAVVLSRPDGGLRCSIHRGLFFEGRRRRSVGQYRSHMWKANSRGSTGSSPSAMPTTAAQSASARPRSALSGASQTKTSPRLETGIH